MPTRQGSIRLFQFAGITVFLHWSWFLVAMYEIRERHGDYSSIVWNALEYLALFGIVTMHEFGHALACRRVGGRADQIVLWPLGGVAYVDPPPRPGATLWSIAAGPLVNVALLPVLGALMLANSYWGPGAAAPDVTAFLRAVMLMNVVLLVFNVMPVYPLDGGQMLRSVLWFAIGRARSLMVAVIIGFAGVAGLGILAISAGSVWLGILSAFAALQCVGGFQHARSLSRMTAARRREGYACPSCKAVPPIGAFWSCGSCHKALDIFDPWPRVSSPPASSSMLNLSLPDTPAPTESSVDAAVCPACRARFQQVKCLECGSGGLFGDWDASAVIDPQPAVDPDQQSTRPSLVPLVLGIVASAIAALLLVATVFFLVVFFNASNRQPRYQAELERLWTSEGFAVPGEYTFHLEPEILYNAYLETSVMDASTLDSVDVRVSNAESGQPVKVMYRTTEDSIRRDNRELSPKASFSVSAAGRYTVQASKERPGTTDARIKVGPSAGLITGSAVSVVGGLAIAAGVAAMLFGTVAVFLFRHSFRQRARFPL